MKRYFYSRYPKLYRCSFYASILLGLVSWGWYFLGGPELCIFIGAACLMSIVPCWKSAQYCTLDEENGIIFDFQNKKYPIKVPEIQMAEFRESKKGSFRHLLIRDQGVKFMRLNMAKEDAEKLVARLEALNPSIQVRHTN